MDERTSSTAQPGKDWSSTSPCHTSLTLATSCSSHPVQDSCILAYRTTTGSAPAYLHSLLRIYIPSRSLRSAVSDASWYHHREAQNHSPEHSRSPVPGWWNDLPIPILNCWISVNLQATTENSSLSTLLDFIIKNKNISFTFSKSTSFFLPFSPSLASLYLFEQCLRLGVTSTSSVCLLLQD